MTKIIEWLKGKKSYVLGVVVIGYGLYKHFFGEHLSWNATVDFVFGGSALMTMRAALAKIGLDTTK